MRTTLTLSFIAALAAPAALNAQQQAPRDTMTGIWSVLNLPRTVDEGRRAGVSSGSIWGVVDSLRRRGVPAQDVQEIIQTEVDHVKAGAPPGNFGAFVQSQLARGLRGRALAQAIHAEHARRGMGKGHNQGRGQGAAGERGRGAQKEKRP